MTGFKICDIGGHHVLDNSTDILLEFEENCRARINFKSGTVLSESNFDFIRVMSIT